MKIFLEVELEVEHNEYDNGIVKLHELRFPGCTQNILLFLSPEELATAQQLVEEEVEKQLQEKFENLRARRKTGPSLGQYRSPETGS